MKRRDFRPLFILHPSAFILTPTYRTCPFFDSASPFFSGFWYVRPADGDFTSHGYSPFKAAL
jgi:hypothetical protein